MNSRALALVLVLVSVPVLPCTPYPKPPTIAQQFASADAVYMARLVSAKQTEKGDPRTFEYEHYEDAVFKVLVAFKGPVPSGQTLTVRTYLTIGSCGMSVNSRRLPIREEDRALGVPSSDIWVLVLARSRLHGITYDYPNGPITDVAEKDIRELFRLSDKR